MVATLLSEAGSAIRSIRTASVLVVDDEAAIRESLQDLFEDEGYEVYTASNGRDALDLLRSLPVKPGVVVLDLIMPILDGNAVYRAMKADPDLAAIPVVISTSDPSCAPVDAVVARKPVAFCVLLALVAGHSG